MPRAAIVEAVTATTMAELRAARDASRADMVELRVDGVVDLDVAGALEGRRTPVIFTCRAPWEGGRFDGSEAERLAFVAEAITRGAEYVDVEWRADRRGLPKGPAGQLVLSHHDFVETPPDLAGRVRAMLAEQPDVLKISVTATRLADCLALRDVARLDVPHVAIAMGSAGQMSRLCPGLFGSRWTYGGTNAPGQVSPDELRRSLSSRHADGRDGDLRHRGSAARAFGLAGDAQRRVRGAWDRRRVPAVRDRGCRRVASSWRTRSGFVARA